MGEGLQAEAYAVDGSIHSGIRRTFHRGAARWAQQQRTEHHRKRGEEALIRNESW
jgi:hypothetical protein